MNFPILFLKGIIFAGILYTSEALNGHFMIFGDLHLDLSYGKRSESCNTDIPPEELGEYGHYECDSPYKLVKSAFAELRNMAQDNNVDFVIWMGDSPGHMNKDNEWTRETFLYAMENVTNLLKEYSSDMMIIPVIGNHDYFPANQLPANNSDIYDEIAVMWEQWLPGEALDSFKDGGYYVIQLSDTDPKLKAIVLNTNLNYVGNSITEGLEDPGKQFDWLETQLNTAVEKNEKVHLFLHIPTGAVDLEPDGEFYIRTKEHYRLNNIIRKYSVGRQAVILGAYGTHVHSDSFKMYYENETGAPVAAIFIPPSVTPLRYSGSDHTTARNPALRMFDFDTTQLYLTDAKQYYLDLPQANDGNTMNWKLEYSFQTDYGLSDITPQSLHELLLKFKEDDNEDFTKYFTYNSVSLKPEDSQYYDGICDCQCKPKHLCAIEFIDENDWKQCMEDNYPLTCSANNLHVFVMQLFLSSIWFTWTYIL